jgi:hypothetical protein
MKTDVSIFGAFDGVEYLCLNDLQILDPIVDIHGTSKGNPYNLARPIHGDAIDTFLRGKYRKRGPCEGGFRCASSANTKQKFKNSLFEGNDR